VVHYTVAIIGGGPGGYETAIRLNQYNIPTVVFEKERLGGVCLNWGCIPTKALVKSAEIWQDIADAGSFGLSATPDTLDYTKVFERKNETVEKLVSGIEFLFRKRQIPVIKACVTMIDVLDGKYLISSAGQEDISADYLVIATGSLPKELPGIKIDEIDILSSTGVLQMCKLPKSIAVIGGGVIGCEFASILHTFGVEVHIIEFLPTLISTEDDEVAKRFQMAFKKSGVKVKTGVGVTACSKVDDQMILTLSDETQLAVEKVLLSVGRIPDSNLSWKQEKPAVDKGAFVIDAAMQTSLPRVYAIGDVTAKMQLAHTASKQGLLVAEQIKAQLAGVQLPAAELSYENIPRCIFTHPEIGSVGLTEKQAQAKFTDIIVGRFPFTANGKALAGGNTFGFVKTIARADTQQLVGMHIIGAQAAELIAQGSILINLGATTHDVEKVVFAHPTLSEAIMEAVEDLNGLSIHKM
jgi:dihydrolipoamide dehydrogenase